MNDANCLMNRPTGGSVILYRRISIFDKPENRGTFEAYRRWLLVNLAMNEKEEAIQNLEQALKEVESQSQAALKISNEIADV